MPKIEFTHQDPAVMDEGVHGKVKLQARWTSEAHEALNARGQDIETTSLPTCEECILQNTRLCTGMESISPRVAGFSDCHKCQSAVVYAEATLTPPEGKDQFLSDLIVDGAQHVRSSVRIYAFSPKLPCASPTKVVVRVGDTTST